MAKRSHNPTTTEPPQVKLTEHAKGWVAKIGGKVKWLAPLNKPQLAMERYHQKKAAWLNGQGSPPPIANNNVSLGVIGQLFVDSKFNKMKARELDGRTYHGYEAGVQQAIDYFGYDTIALHIPIGRWSEFRAHLVKKCGDDVHTLNRHIGAVRSLSKWASQNEHIDRPFRFGTEFNRPSLKVMRAAKKSGGDRTYTPQHVRKILSHAEPVLKAMFLLSINGGIGNTDIAKLEDGHVKGDRLEFPRSKTGVERVVPLWPETVAAIKAARAVRPEPSSPELASRVFLTERGFPYVRNNFDGNGNLTSTTDKIATLFWQGMEKLGIERTFYDGRRTFQTIGDHVGPPHVVRAIMGHAERGDDMSGRYRQGIPLEQMVKVVNHVRKQLNVAKCFSSGSAKASPARPSSKGRPSGTAGKPQRRKVGTAK